RSHGSRPGQRDERLPARCHRRRIGGPHGTPPGWWRRPRLSVGTGGSSRPETVRTVPALFCVTLLLAAAAQPAAAGGKPPPSPTCSSASPVPSPAPDPTSSPSAADLCTQRSLLDQVRQRLGTNVATALAIQEQLRTSLEENDRAQSALTAQIATARREEAALDAALARSVYLSPDSFLLLVIRAGSLQELIAATSDAFAAGSRTATDEHLLDADLARLKREHDQATAARLEKARVEAALQSDLARLVVLRQSQEESSRNLADQTARIRYELANLDRQMADLAQRIAVALDTDQTAIIARAEQQVW